MELINLSPFSSNDEKSVSPKYKTLNSSVDKKKLQKDTKIKNKRKTKYPKHQNEKDSMVAKKKKMSCDKKIFKNE